MNEEKIQKKNKRSSSQNPKIKIYIDSNNNEKGNNKSDLIPNEEETELKNKKVKFLINDMHLKTEFIYLSPSKTNKNSILKKSKQNKTQIIDSFLFEESKNKNYNDNFIPLINNNNNNFKHNNNSETNLNKIKNNNNNKHIFYPFLDINNIKNKESITNKSKTKIKSDYMNHISEENKIKKSMIIKSSKNRTHNSCVGIKLINLDNKYKTNSNFSNNLFPTSINEISDINKNKKKIGGINISENTKYNKTENNFYTPNKKLQKFSKIIFGKQNERNVNKENLYVNNNPLILKFKEYQKKIEPSFSLIKNSGIILSKKINNNPFMRKIENLKNINQFEIIFHKSIMNNIIEEQKKGKTGFFQGECCGVNTNKDKSNGIYICENRANIFNVSEMIDRMNPLSVMKFNELLRKDYKEFLGYNKKDYRNKKSKKEDKLRKKLINKYHKELFYENEIADKYNIKKNPGIKFIKEKETKKNNSEF